MQLQTPPCPLTWHKLYGERAELCRHRDTRLQLQGQRVPQESRGQRCIACPQASCTPPAKRNQLQDASFQVTELTCPHDLG